MRARLGCILILLILFGCSGEEETVLGVWSNGHQGKLLDISPSGFYAEIWVESQVYVYSYKAEDDEIERKSMCSLVPQEEMIQEYLFTDGGLEFPGKGAQYVRFAREHPSEAPDPALVGLWYRETVTRKKEFIEFTPWSTVIWNRWDGEAGKETLSSGWAAYILSKEGNLLLTGVENNDLLNWTKPVKYTIDGSRLSLRLPEGLGKRDYTKTTPSELHEAAKSLTF